MCIDGATTYRWMLKYCTIQNMTNYKFVDNFYLHRRAVVVQKHNYINRLLTYSDTVLLCSR